MQGIGVRIDGDLDPFAKALQNAEGISNTVGRRIQADLSATAMGLERQIISAKSAGTDWDVYASELQAVQVQLKAVNAQIAANDAAQAVNMVGNSAKEAARHIPGLSLALRELLVIGREFLAGRWSNIPGSFTRLLQGLYAMKAELGILRSLFTLTAAAWAAGLLLISAVTFKLYGQIQKLGEALTGLQFPNLEPPDLSKLTVYAEIWKSIAKSVREATDAINSANTAFKHQQEQMNEQQRTERELMEVQKEIALRKAHGNPHAERLAREEFDRKEHDLEVKQFKEKEDAALAHVAALNKEREAKEAAAQSIKVMTDKDEADALKELKKQADADTEARKDKKGKEVPSRIAEAQALLDKFTPAVLASVADQTSRGVKRPFVRGLDYETVDSIAEAQRVIEDHVRAQAKYEQFQRAKNDRDALRERRAELAAEAARAGADSVEAQSAYDQMKKMDAQILADNDKIRNARLELDSLKDDGPTRSRFVHGHVSGLQQIGAFTPGAVQLHDVARRTLTHVANIDRKLGTGSPSRASTMREHNF